MATPTNIPTIITPSGITVQPQKLFPQGAQQYIDNGLTYQSNNSDFVKRDDNGNIILTQDSINNQNLIIEAMSLFYTNQSVVRNIDTRFKYFKFPAENISTPDISIDLSIVENLDLIFTLLEPSANFSPTTLQIPVGILMDKYIAGVPQIGNGYRINSGVKESGADLRFRIRLNHTYVGQDITSFQVQSGFGQDTVDELIADGAIPADADVTVISPGGSFPDSITYSLPSTGTIFFTIIKNPVNGDIDRQFRVLTLNDDAFISGGETLTKEYDIIIPNEDFDTDDRFAIGALVGQAGEDGKLHTILAENSYWSITDAAKDVNINNETN